MKKLLTILTITALTIAPMFAVVQLDSKSAQVQLVNTIEETPVSYSLSYDEIFLEDGTTNFEIEVAPLTQDGETENFRIHATSNMNKDMAVSVKVAPETFKTTLNGDDNFDSNILPVVKNRINVDVLTAGKHNSLVVSEFHLDWEGDKDLPAGDYTSNVQIEYSIQ